MSISKIKIESAEYDLHASKLTIARTIALSGDVSGSTTFDGSKNVTITTTVTGTISSTSITPAGTVSQPTFTGTAASHTHTFTGSAVNSSTES